MPCDAPISEQRIVKPHRHQQVRLRQCLDLQCLEWARKCRQHHLHHQRVNQIYNRY
jgi:hypothetical protein